MPFDAAFVALALSCAPQVHPQTMAKLAHIESSFNPYAIGIDTRGVFLTRQPKNEKEAIETAKNLMALRINFGAGAFQVSSRNFKKYGLTPETVFDTCINAKKGQEIFLDCFDRDVDARTRSMQTRLKRAGSCYNTGNYRDGFTNGYVAKFVTPLPSLKQ